MPSLQVGGTKVSRSSELYLRIDTRSLPTILLRAAATGSRPIANGTHLTVKMNRLPHDTTNSLHPRRKVKGLLVGPERRVESHTP